ncbi:MAG TPA: hypothetical protein VJN89_08795 [Candidatus Acidoferrum sp.]|nr:hypothetical protein [Candidatus Acidoferrum sp.]
MADRQKVRGKLVRLLALSLAVLFVVFVSQIASHSHAKGQDEATCQVCQAAHLAPVTQAGILLLHAPLLATGYVQPFLSALHEELFFHDSPSRAPPSA